MRITCFSVSDTFGLKILIISVNFQLWIAGNVCYMENSPPTPKCVFICLLCVRVFPWWWLYPQHPKAFLTAYPLLSSISTSLMLRRQRTKCWSHYNRRIAANTRKKGKETASQLALKYSRWAAICTPGSDFVLSMRSLADYHGGVWLSSQHELCICTAVSHQSWHKTDYLN